MPSPDALAAALRAHARGLRCPEAATGLLIAQSWLYREDFTSQFVRTRHDATCGQQAATIDWPAVVTALGTSPLLRYRIWHMPASPPTPASGP